MEEYLATVLPFSRNPQQSPSELSAVLPSSNFLLLFLAASLAFTFFTFPCFEPHAVKKSPDSLILALVLFPIACGLLSRSNPGDNGRLSGWHLRSDTRKSSLYDPTTPCRCHDSYYLWIVYVVEEMEVPVTPPPGERAAQRKRALKRTYQTTAHKLKDEVDKPLPAPWVPPPRPPPPTPVFHLSEEKGGKKRGGPATKQFSSSLRMKKKKERLESIENFESLLAFQPLPSCSHQPPPSPPRVLPTLFASKKGKTKEALSAPPPVPPPPAALRKTRAKPDAVFQSTANLIAIKKSHAPVTMTPNYDESSDDSGTSSPSTPVPPPRPPFEVPSWTFAMSGHHVQIKSPNAQRHKSPDTEDDEDSISETIESASNASSEATSLLSSPIPDVNERASKFIATFKAWLNQEKTNSTKRRRSNLCPEII